MTDGNIGKLRRVIGLHERTLSWDNRDFFFYEGVSRPLGACGPFAGHLEGPRAANFYYSYWDRGEELPLYYEGTSDSGPREWRTCAPSGLTVSETAVILREVVRCRRLRALATDGGRRS